MKKLLFVICFILLLTGCAEEKETFEINDSAYTTMNIYGTKIQTDEFIESIKENGLSNSEFDDLEEYINEALDERLGVILDKCGYLSGDELAECFLDYSR